MNNLYWSIYKNLEKEVLSFVDIIHFDDTQLSVYSVKIVDLIISCAVEIEAISKELYLANGGIPMPLDSDGKPRVPFFDTDCLHFLDERWILTQKQVIITNINIHFTNEDNITLTPLRKANIRGKCDWKKAYQSIKHNRNENLRKGNLKILLQIMAALYILNIYYKGESFPLNKLQRLPDESLGSSIFSVTASICKTKFPDTEPKIIEDDSNSIYLIKPTDDSYAKYYKEAVNAFNKQKYAIISAGYVIPKNEDGEDEEILHSKIYQIALEVGGPELIKRIPELEQPAIKLFEALSYEAVLNKNSGITGGTF